MKCRMGWRVIEKDEERESESANKVRVAWT